MKKKLLQLNKRKCSACKKVFPLNKNNFYADKTKPSGVRYTCKKCADVKDREYRASHKEILVVRHKAYYASHKKALVARSRIWKKNNPDRVRETNKKHARTPTTIFARYRLGAKARNLSFEITKEQFLSFWQKPCSYCGDEIKYIGLDRIDNDKGYTPDNIRSCCAICNKMKRDQKENDFLERCKRITALQSLFYN